MGLTLLCQDVGTVEDWRHQFECYLGWFVSGLWGSKWSQGKVSGDQYHGLVTTSRFGLAQALPSAFQAAILSLDATNQQRFVLSIMLIVTMRVFLWSSSPFSSSSFIIIIIIIVLNHHHHHRGSFSAFLNGVIFVWSGHCFSGLVKIWKLVCFG